MHLPDFRMSFAAEAVPGLAVILVLGMRHGLDPDHLAAIDGLTMQTLPRRPRWAPWMGAMFALGHALVVMLIVLAAALASARWQPPVAWFNTLEWLPPLLLLALAVLNARALLQRDGPALAIVRGRMLPAWLRAGGGPWTGIGLGMLFAAVFDTALQAAAWGYAVTALGGVSIALKVGLVFSVGMLLTDTFDGWVTARVMRHGGAQLVTAFRRRLGWPIVVMCAAMGSYLAASKLNPALTVSALTYSVLGGALLVLMLGLYLYTLLGLKRAAAMPPM